MPNAEQTIVLLGNSNPQMQREGVSVPAEHLEQSETRVEMHPGFDDDEFVERTLSTPNDRILSMIAREIGKEHRRYAIGVQQIDQIMTVHAAGDAPDWVWSSDPAFAKAIAHFFSCPAVDEPPSALLTNSGRDALHAQHMSTSAQPASFNYMALANSATATTPAATDTTLTGEITTAGGGLIRAQATYAHTAGTNTTTLTKTFTANGTDSLPVTVSQGGLFNASTAGTMAYKDALNASATLSVSGDSTTVTYTVTAG